MPQRSPLVTYYHSVAPARFEGWPLGFLTQLLPSFEREMRFMAERRWRSIFLDEWHAIRTGRQPLKGDELCITFDDGLLDNWVYAYPVLRKYGMRMTIFVCPELIEPTDRVRPNLEDVWNGRVAEKDLEGLGQLSWGELRAMQRSGHVDVQSHTMTHTKHIVSDRLVGAHHGGFEGFYPMFNTLLPEEKPRYMHLLDLDRRLPLGTPLFEENSAVVAHQLRIDPEFMEKAAVLAREHDLSQQKERAIHAERLQELYRRCMTKGGLVSPAETFQEHVERVEYEIIGSKNTIERELDKPVRFLCWPHGGNSAATHAIAREAGYVATTVGKMYTEEDRPDRIPRVGTGWDLSTPMMRLKFDYKMYGNLGREPFRTLHALNRAKNRALGRH